MKPFDFLKRRTIANCGHKTLKKDTITAFGESVTMEIPIIKGKTGYCHRCLEKMSIKCAWCGRTIFIGDPITLYSPTESGFEAPKHAVIYNNDPLQLVGCLRRDCARTGADRRGFWYPPGKVMRVLSPIEMAIQSNKTIYVSDINDPKEAIRIF